MEPSICWLEKLNGLSHMSQISSETFAAFYERGNRQFICMLEVPFMHPFLADFLAKNTFW